MKGDEKTMNNERLLDINFRYEIGAGAVGNFSPGCGGIESITADSNPDNFLQREDIDSACNAISKMQESFESIDERFNEIGKESEIAFECGGAYPIENKARGINRTIRFLGMDIIAQTKEIENIGEAHRRAEAATYYIKVKERLVELNEKVHTAVVNYNILLDEAKAIYMHTPISDEPGEDGQAQYPSEYDADQKYGGHLRVSPDAPYESSLDTIIHIESNCNYHSDIDDTAFGGALNTYNECANTKGKKAEELKAQTNFNDSDIRTPYESVTTIEMGFADDYLTEYEEKHEDPDFCYYATVTVKGPDGTTTRLPVFYDANDHTETNTGELFEQTDASRLIIMINGVPCYLTNASNTKSYNNTQIEESGVASDHYNVSIPTNQDGTPSGELGTVYNNHDNKDDEDGKLYLKDAEGNTYTVDWGTVQYTIYDEDDQTT